MKITTMRREHEDRVEELEGKMLTLEKQVDSLQSRLGEKEQECSLLLQNLESE